MNVLVLGAGAMGRNHVRNLVHSKRVENVFVVEPSKEVRDELNHKHEGVKAFATAEEAFAAGAVDAAIVAVPTKLHFRVAMQMIERGLPTLVEKPITDSLEDGKKLIHAAKEKKVMLTVGHIERFNPAVAALKEHVEEIGDIVYASTYRFGVPTNRKLGAAFFDQAVHDIDVLSYLSGEYPKKVQAVERSLIDKDAKDLCSALYEFPSFTAAVEANRVTPIKTREVILLGTKGTARLDYISQELTISTSEKKDYKYSNFDEILFRVGRGTEIKPYFRKEEPLKLELEHFLDCVEGKCKPLVSGEDGLHAVAAAQFGIKAAETGEKQEIKF
ncbi:MAG: Gfo/Idh/MocA family oxidoreductase [Candidatus Micrarchaeota archaeon]